MKSLKLAHMTLKSLFGKPVTLNYPAVVPEPIKDRKGHIMIDIDGCLFDGACSRACPTDSINVNRTNHSWEINPFTCVGCRNCIIACDEQVLSMETSYEPVSQTKSSHIHNASPERVADLAEQARLRKERQAKKKAEREAAKAASSADENRDATK